MLAAAQDAPLDDSTIDVGWIVRRERRTRAARRGTGAALAVAAVLAVALPAWRSHHTPAGPPAAHPSASRPMSDGPSGARSSAVPSAAPPIRLTAHDLSAAVPAAGDHAGEGQWQAKPGGPGWLVLLYLRRIPDASGDPCIPAAGAVPGRDGAPTDEDVCYRVEADGVSGWVRRWGYSPQDRPWTTPDTTVVEFFFEAGGRAAVFGLSNTVPPASPSTPASTSTPAPTSTPASAATPVSPLAVAAVTTGPAFAISDADLVATALSLSRTALGGR
jgi:hypothetical protein